MERADRSSVGLRGFLISGIAVLGVAGVLLGSGPATSPRPAPADGNYIGAEKCKNCHNSEETGDQYGKWMKEAHAKAFETLASDKAKAIAKEKGIDDPQKADACVKCHVTAHGVAAEQIKKGFKAELGVQCESCHGPGEDHMKGRMKAAMAKKADEPVPEGEIGKGAGVETCVQCHNSESPTFEGFCYCKRLNDILHWNPKKHSAEEMKAGYECKCGDACDCANGKCADDCKVCKGPKK